MLELHYVVSGGRYDLVWEAVDIVRASVSDIEVTNGGQEVSLESLLNRTGGFRSTSGHQLVNLRTVFTKVISYIPSVTFVLFDTEGDVTRLNWFVDQWGIFFSFLQSNRTNSFDVQYRAMSEVAYVTPEGFRQQAIMQVHEDELRILFTLDKGTSIICQLHVLSLLIS
ncbi:hypothetical protein D3C73_1094830 [compost metagenome]